MKQKTLLKRLEKVDVAKNSTAYKLMAAFAKKPNKQPIRTCNSSGSGRFTTNIDRTEHFKILCRKLKLKYEFGNDSPRGGLMGNYVKILTKIEVE